MRFPSAQNLLRAAVASMVLFTGSSLFGAETRRPNVLFIAIDDLKPVLGCYGDADVKTPNIDRLAARGMLFANNHCQQALCGPSRASILTGWRPDRTRVWDLATKMRDVNPDLLTLPEHFHNQSYTTVSMGKIFDGRCCDGWATDDVKSWDHRVQAPQRRPELMEGAYGQAEHVAEIRRRRADAKAKGLTGDALKASEYKPPTDCGDVPDDAYRDGSIALTAAQWLGKLAREDKPFFLAVGFDRPHLPFNAPKKYWDRYSREQFKLHPFQDRPAGAPEFSYQNSGELRNGYSDVPKTGPIPAPLQAQLIHGYYASVSYLDANVGIVLDELEKQGMANNTIVVLWGDHGWHLGDHGMFCKHSNYEQATRAPLIISSPNLKPAAARTNCPTEFVDVFPTLCELAGVPTPDGLEGVSLKPLFVEPEKPVKSLAISQYFRNVDGKPVMGYTYRGQRYRYVKWIQKDYRSGQTDGPVVGTELYDYQTDPMETRNLAQDAAYGSVVEKFEKAAAGGWQGLQGKAPEGL